MPLVGSVRSGLSQTPCVRAFILGAGIGWPGSANAVLAAAAVTHNSALIAVCFIVFLIDSSPLISEAARRLGSRRGHAEKPIAGRVNTESNLKINLTKIGVFLKGIYGIY
jgi:hypothetical protein